MIPELGFIALLTATLAAALLAVLPTAGLAFRLPQLSASARYWAGLFCLFTLLAIGCLTYAFVADDFSVGYVAAHSNSRLPVLYKAAAVWGGHEGSMLFWLFALSLWTAAFAAFSRHLDPALAARSLSILGFIGLGFCLFILFLSNPFERHFPHPLEGRDLNPMLQDIGLIFHPPLLYIGYVGFAVNFALTVAALLHGSFNAQVARWMRPWVLLSWLFLTLGIALGSWWAYYELGWGGWWFWDPVENASLMPWLLGGGLLHGLAATAKRGIFPYWSALFSLSAFAFSILGTFIVRSGALTSVHAFAIDSARGGALLLLFFILVTAALGIFAWKADMPLKRAAFGGFSRPSLMLIALILFAVATASVFLGTFYPMLFNALGWGSISVGAPYFNSIFLPLVLIMLVAMVAVLSVARQGADRRQLKKNLLLLLPALSLSLFMNHNALARDPALSFSPTAFVLVSLALWNAIVLLWRRFWRFNLSRWGMLLAHGGVVLVVIGAVMNSFYGSEIGVRLKPNERAELAGYEFHYLGFKNELGQNYTTEKAHFEISKNQQFLTALFPERRHYDVRSMNMSEVGLQWGWFGDLYIVMGDKLGGEFSFRLHYKPFVRWLWFGALCMAAGALLAALNSLRRQNEQ